MLRIRFPNAGSYEKAHKLALKAEADVRGVKEVKSIAYYTNGNGMAHRLITGNDGSTSTIRIQLRQGNFTNAETVNGHVEKSIRIQEAQKAGYQLPK